MASQAPIGGMVGILLAAGKGARFDPDGARDKLLQSLPDGELVAVAAAKNLLAVLPQVVAVVRPGNDVLAKALQATGCRVTVCSDAGEGMAASLVHALSQTRGASAWLIALADMPYVQPETILKLTEAIRNGAQIAVPVFRGRRGNPVVFGRAHLAGLLQLRGDEGARRLLKMLPVTEVKTDDPGVVHDIDTTEDLRQPPLGGGTTIS
ncbi:MAG TPA: nucleotidyltransferase family protein [Noviherbaspirillum sp.]